MPFQSEKQRRYLHANHPEIAKRWERDYANGGISNHFKLKDGGRTNYIYGGISHPDGRRGFPGGAGTPGGYQADWGTTTTTNGGNGGGGNGGTSPIHTGPSPAELAAQKAAADAKAKAELEAAKHKAWIDRKDKKKKKVKHTQTIKDWVGKKVGDITGSTQHNINNQLLKDALAAGRITENQYKRMGGYDVAQQLPGPTLTDVPIAGLFSEFYNLNKARLNVKDPTDPYSQYEKYGPAESTELNIRGTTGLNPSDLQTYESIVGEYQPVGGMYPGGEHELVSQINKEPLSGKLDFVGGKIYDWMHKAAKGGVARKNYYHGGILDINASEEIISDDGNDIELTAYNAEFDDPNDLSTGVKSLFMKKGGNVRLGPHTATDLLAKKNPDGTRSKYQPPGGGETSLGSGAAYSGGASDRGPRDDPDRFGPTKDTTPSDGGMGAKETYIQTQYTSPEAKKARDRRDIKSIIELRKEEKYDTWKQRFQDIPGTAKTSIYKSKVNVDYKRDIYEKSLATQKAKMKNMGLLKLIPAGIVLAITQNPKLAMETFSLSGTDVINIVRYGLPVMEAKKDLIAALTDSKTAHLQDVDIFNPNEMVNLDDTDFPDIMKELKDLTKKPEEEEQRDRPEQIEVVPIGKEIEEYEGTYAMSPWERIKANQAKRALLVEKGIIQDNPIVDESVTDITMQANSGGLANLFRVKNQ